MDPITITNAIIFTVNEQDTIISNGTVRIHNGFIEHIGPTVAASHRVTNEYVIDARGRMALIPGLIDSHSHSSLLRGFYENETMLEWVKAQELENRVLTEDDAYTASLICYLEAVKGGTTCLSDMSRFMFRCGDAAKKIGLRVNLIPYLATNPEKAFFETIESTEKLVESHHLAANGRIRVSVGLSNLLFCNPQTYQWAVNYAASQQLRIHIQSSSFQQEVDAVQKKFGKRPISVLKDLGILGPQTVISDCIWLDEGEIQLLADSGTSTVYCPIREAKLASGYFPYTQLRQKKVSIGLGSGGPNSSNSLDMFESMKFASLLQKAFKQDPKVASANEVLRMATIEGAKLLGLENEIGSIEIGKKADVVLVDLWKPHFQPVLNDNLENSVLWNLIYSANAGDVHTVIVDGHVVMSDRKMTYLNEDHLLEMISSQTRDLLYRRSTFKEKGLHA